MAPPYKRSNTASKDKDSKKRPMIVVKRVKRGGRAAHHGGAWKVAYADFVTAMMAFFLLLWLLSTSSKATLQGLAEYFTPTSGIGDMRPIGIDRISPSPMPSKDPGINLSKPGVMQQQAGATRNNPDNPSPVESEEEDNMFEKGASAINQAIESDSQLSEYKENITVGQTPDGLRIDIKDSDKYPMFNLASAQLTEHGQLVLGRLTPLIRRMPNYMSITGYTDASVLETQATSRWKLSSARAEAALDYLVKSGLEPERPQKIIGAGDSQVLSANEPRSAKNRRVSLLMIRGSHILIPHSAIPGATP